MTLNEISMANVQAFYDLVFNQNRPADAIERYAGDVSILHNPQARDGYRGTFRRSRKEP